MADTRQIITWTLERPCPIREAATLCDPSETLGRLRRLQSGAKAYINGDVVDGIWVTSTYWGSDAADEKVDIPCSGESIDEIAEPFGGWKQVNATCQGCQANVAHTSEPALAGCVEIMDVMHPYSEELEELLWDTIRFHELELRLRDCFQVTTPLWFGFWIDSPLSRAQCDLLLDLLPRALPRLWGKDEHGEDVPSIFDKSQFIFPDFDPAEHYGGEFNAFFRALQASINWDLPLHVQIAPPGHVDLGFVTTFAHCPRCKAEARVERWSEEVPSDEHECHVCEHQFNPSKTHRSESDDRDYDRDSLETKLGDDYDAFTLRYAESKGFTAQQMTEALDIHREGPIRRDIEARRKRVRHLRRKFAPKSEPAEDQLRERILLEIAPGATLELVLIPAGEFLMGSDEYEASQPQHRVRFARPFYLGKFPVLQSQWEAIMGDNPSRCEGDALLPVEQVTWLDAQAFCDRLSERIGRHMRLPSEAEWEYACRAGSATCYWFGDEINAERANYDWMLKPLAHAFTFDDSNSDRRRDPTTTPVDRFPANPWGLCDMHGNVEEWCEDSWHADYDGAPDDGSAWIDADEPIEHMARGGAAYTSGDACSSAARRQQRANCGARIRPDNDEPDDDDDGWFASIRDMLDSTEYYGLRIACSPIEADAQ